MILAKAYLKVNRPEDAKMLVEKFLAKNQESATMRGLLGLSLFLLKNEAGATKEWDTALKLDPHEPVAKRGWRD